MCQFTSHFPARSTRSGMRGRGVRRKDWVLILWLVMSYHAIKLRPCRQDQRSRCTFASTLTNIHPVGKSWVEDAHQPVRSNLYQDVSRKSSIVYATVWFGNLIVLWTWKTTTHSGMWEFQITKISNNSPDRVPSFTCKLNILPFGNFVNFP